MRGVMIAGTNSGCGKTTVSIGLMKLLKNKGFKVAPFKTGPDYIDPLFHQEVLQSPSYNLDAYLCDTTTIQHLYTKHMQDKDLAVVEGVMGFYDGRGMEASGSSYQLSNMLQLPVILVVNCKGLYQSVSAIVKGFMEVQSHHHIGGVILNHVPSASYFEFLKSIIQRDCDIRCIGYLPYNPDLKIESRHLGLIQAEEVQDLHDKVDQLAKVMEDTIDVEALVQLAEQHEFTQPSFHPPNIDLTGIELGVPYDKAFRFYYRDNLELLQDLGASLHYFSPLKDKHLPTAINALYLGGGYPEVFAEQLSENTTLLKEIRKKLETGMPCYAECGGLMYLSESIQTTENVNYKMVGFFKARTQLTSKLQRFGYATIAYNDIETRCHEFHKSDLIDDSNPNFQRKYTLTQKEKSKSWQCGLQRSNVLAAYAHVHFYSNFQFLEQIAQLWKQAITSR